VRPAEAAGLWAGPARGCWGCGWGPRRLLGVVGGAVGGAVGVFAVWEARGVVFLGVLGVRGGFGWLAGALVAVGAAVVARGVGGVVVVVERAVGAVVAVSVGGVVPVGSVVMGAAVVVVGVVGVGTVGAQFAESKIVERKAQQSRGIPDDILFERPVTVARVHGRRTQNLAGIRVYEM